MLNREEECLFFVKVLIAKLDSVGLTEAEEGALVRAVREYVTRVNARFGRTDSTGG